MLLDGLAGGLFVEHLTVYQVLISIAASCSIVWLNHKNHLNHFDLLPILMYLVGTVASFIIMFSHSSYYQGTTSYRKVGFSIQTALQNYRDSTHFWFGTFNFAIIAMFCVSIIIIAVKTVKSPAIMISLTVIATIFLVYYLLANLYIHYFVKLNNIFQPINISSRFAIIDGALSLLFYLFVIIATLTFFSLHLQNINLYFFLFSAIALIIPFAYIVRPIYSQEYFDSYVFMFILALIFLNTAVNLLDIKWIKTLLIIFTALFIFNSAVQIVQLTQNYLVNQTRVQNKDFCDGTSSLKEYVPHRQYLIQNDLKMLQLPTYWRRQRNLNFSDYFYNTYTE